MTTKRKKLEQTQFLDVVAAAGMPRDVARAIMRDTTTLNRIAELTCSVEMTERQTAAVEKREKEAEARITKRCAPYKISVHFDGDPRGYVVELLLPSGKSNTWGGAEVGYGVPTGSGRY